MGVTLAIAISQDSQNINHNQSTVTVNVYATWSFGSYNLLEKSGWLTIDGTKYTFTSPFNTGRTEIGTAKIFGKTVTITHNNDGTKTVACSASYTTGVSSGTISASTSKTLTTIARKSALTVANGTLGTSQTLTIVPRASGFTHTITAECGSATTTVCTKTTNTTVSFTPPLSWASQNTTGTTVTVRYTITTYNGNTSIGSYTYSKSCSIPASVKPSCSISCSSVNTPFFGNYGEEDDYLQNISSVYVAIVPTLSYGSAISSYKTVINNITYTSANFTSDVLRTSGTITITTTVTDERGRKGSATTTISVTPYSPPMINKLTVHRVNQDGTENDQGNFIKVLFGFSYTYLNEFNTETCTLSFKKSSEDVYGEGKVIDATSMEMYDPYTIVNGVYSQERYYIFSAASDSSYDVRLHIVDGMGKVAVKTATVSTAFTLMHWRADGTGIGIGKIAEEPDLFDVGMNTRFVGTVYGNVMGLNRLPEIPANSDLNKYMTTGCYAVYRNDNASTIANMPVARAGRLEVSSATGEGIRVAQWSYIRQKYIPYNIANATWERDITRSEEDVWTYGPWYRTTLSSGMSEQIHHGQVILWEGGRYMTADHTINLAEPVSSQPNGIVLTFCKYANGAAQDNNFNHFFVPKILVLTAPGYGSAFTMMDTNFGQICHKYLYINDSTISGHANNSATGTGTSGITYANNKYVLRYVFGV